MALKKKSLERIIIKDCLLWNLTSRIHFAGHRGLDDIFINLFIRSEDVMHKIVKVRQKKERNQEFVREKYPYLYEKMRLISGSQPEAANNIKTTTNI